MRTRTPLTAIDTPFEKLHALDRELARLARKSGSLMLAVGLGLDALARTGGHTHLSFASIEAYTLERCERSATWTRQARKLAGRSQKLPRLRRALISGRVSWSMAQEVARVATADDEAQWIQICGLCTVSQFRDLVKQLREQKAPPADDPATEDEAQEHCLLTVTANREDTWLYECARMLHRHMVGGTTSDLIEALVAEATSSMMELLPRNAADPNDLAPSYDAQNAWNGQLAKYREEAERLCEPRVLQQKNDGIEEEGERTDDRYDFSGPPETIDRTLRQISGELAERDLLIGELADKLWNADGWRRLGYATDRQYARERLGMALSSVKDRRKLARRLCRLSHLKGALLDGYIGYEAARLVAAVATPANDAAWADRARHRTLVHLREDIRAAELLSSVKRRRNVEPPSVELVTEVRVLEAAVVTGAVFTEVGGATTTAKRMMTTAIATSQKSVPTTATDAPTAKPPTAIATSQKSDSATDDAQSDITALWTAFAEARRAPAQRQSLARDTLRLRVQPDIRALYRGVERLYLRHRPRPMSFFHFACLNFIETWVRDLPPVAYADIYARDGLRCANPFCTRRDCTPHHIRFRAHGGGDEPENLTTLCVWCHLEGVHVGRISVRGEAPAGLVWRLGNHTTVMGRDRYRAA